MKEEVEKIIEDNKNLIYKIASKYSYYYNIEDLFQVGTIGLIKAYKNYKMNCNVLFSTYAYKYILGEIVSYIKNDRNIKVNEDIIKIYKSYEKSKDFLTNEYMRCPSHEEICSFMNIDVDYMTNVIEMCAFTVSLDDELKEDYTLSNIIGVDNSNNIDYLIDLKSELEKLSENEREIIKLRYFKDYTQSEVAKHLNLSQVKVSRDETKVLKKIREKIAS